MNDEKGNVVRMTGIRFWFATPWVHMFRQIADMPGLPLSLAKSPV